MSIFSDNIKMLRNHHRCKQGDLADAIGVNRASLSDYERGRTEPNFSIMLKIAEFFDVSLDDLIKNPISDTGRIVATNGGIGSVVANGSHIQQQVNTNTTEKDLSHKVALLEQEIQALKDKVADKDAHISSLREIIALYKK